MASPTDTRKFAREQAGRLLGRLAFQANHTIKSRDSVAVHDLRVAIRRFTRLLKIFQLCFDGKETRKLRRRLKKVLDLASDVGRYDTALKAIAKPRLDRTGLRSKLQSRRKEATRDLTGVLRRWIERKSSMKWRAALESSLTSQGDVFRGIPIEQTAGEILPTMAKDFFHLGNEVVAAKAPPAELEEFRIACRKFRYTLELFAPLCATGYNRWLEKVRQTQVLLGEIRDWNTVEQIVAPFKGGEALAGRLKKKQRKQRDEFRRHWSKQFGDPQQVRIWIDSLRSPTAIGRALRKPVGRSLTASSKPAQGREKVSLPSSR